MRVWARPSFMPVEGATATGTVAQRRQELAPHFSAGMARETGPSPFRDDTLAERLAGIELDARFLQEREEFRFVIAFPVVFLLPLDVGLHCRQH